MAVTIGMTMDRETGVDVPRRSQLDIETIEADYARKYREWLEHSPLSVDVRRLSARVRELEAATGAALGALSAQKELTEIATGAERQRCLDVFEDMVNLYPDLETFRREIEAGEQSRQVPQPCP